MRRLSVCLGRLLGAHDNPYLGYTLHSDKYMFPSIVTKVGLSGWWRAPKNPTVASRAGLEPARRGNSRILGTVVTS